ncbi:MAG: WD40 repeat domain-containing protein [Pedobacter sp.]|nr:WD40 repeat domain-containing protein [Pedobacter sp.]
MLRIEKTLSGHQNPIYALTDGQETSVFYSAGNDKGIVEWSLEKMAFVKVKLPVTSSVYSLHRYQNLLFIGERSGLLSIYDLDAEKLIEQISAHTRPIFDVKFVASKNELISTGEDGTVAVWSLQDFSLLYRFEVSADTVRCMAICPQENEIAFGCKDNLIQLYQLNDYTFKQTLAGHQFGVTALAYHPLGHNLISGSRDAQLKIWDLPDHALRQTIPAHLFTVYQIAFHPTLPYFATCSQDKSIKLWDAENFKLYKILSLEKAGIGHRHSINKILWNHDGSKLISTGDDRQIMVWEME